MFTRKTNLQLDHPLIFCP